MEPKAPYEGATSEGGGGQDARPGGEMYTRAQPGCVAGDGEFRNILMLLYVLYPHINLYQGMPKKCLHIVSNVSYAQAVVRCN